MRILFSLSFFVTLLSCGTREASNNVAYETPSVLDDESEYATFYVVIADTGTSYYPLQKEMYRLSQLKGWDIDTMFRTYYPDKDLIALPEDDEDEIYAGDYYPRRFPSETLSLEYLLMYEDNVSEKSIALVRGIYEEQKQAEAATKILKKDAPKAYWVAAKIYTGCMH